MSYAELHCISNFSFLRGASHPQELVSQAAHLGYHAIAITDECSLAGVVRAHVQQKILQSQGHDIQLIVGSEFTLPNQEKIVALAKDKQSYEALSAFISLCRRRSEKGNYEFRVNDLRIHLSNCLLIYIPRTSHSQPLIEQRKEQNNLLNHLKSHPACWIGSTRTLGHFDEINYQKAYQIACELDKPMVACGNVHMHCSSRKTLQDTLTAIRLRTPIKEAGHAFFCNAENHLRPINTIKKLYPEDLLHETLNIAERCHFSLLDLRYQYPQELVPNNQRPIEHLRSLVEAGIKKRWGNNIERRTRQQIEKELALIEELHYEYYFLTVHDIVSFARSRDILCQGRGSAANSVICYCLFITEVDPQRISLLFERFISKERDEPPDIDVDFEHERREEVIQYIYKKYSRERAALAATVITYRSRSAIKDVGKALGLSSQLTEKLSRSLGWWSKPDELEAHLRNAGMDLAIDSKESSQHVSHHQETRSKDLERMTHDGTTSLASLFMHLVKEILGFPRHLSQHVGGFIISDGPISRLVPVENASMPDRTVIQWDKDDIEALGLLKVDVLALGMLSAIRKALALANSYPQQHQPISIASIPDEDAATYDMLCNADSVGVFQVESRAQMSMLPRLKPRTFYDLVIQVAIVRPGPIQGDMVHPFLRRREGVEAIDYENEAVRSVLSRTLGVPIFQEQVIKLAMVAAGFSGGEADQLRRAMASWGKNGNLLQFEHKLLQGMRARGYSQDFAQRLFEQMKGFGSYGFPESHAASFALLVYVSSWLKKHYPAAFYTAIINSQPMGFYSPSQLIQDAKRHDINILPADVSFSAWDCTLDWSADSAKKITMPRIRLGMRLIKGLNQEVANRIQVTRNQQRFSSLADLHQRCHLNAHDRQCLIRANATQSLSGNRFQSHWQSLALDSQLSDLAHEHCTAENADQTIGEQRSKEPLSTQDDSYLNDQVLLNRPSEVEDIRANYSYTGINLNRHPMLVMRQQAPFNRCKRYTDLQSVSHKRFVHVAGIVTGRQRPGTASGVIFLTLEDETGNINVVVWQNRQQQYRDILLKSKLLLVKGILERKDQVIHVIAGQLIDMSHRLEGYLLPSRDFH